MAQYYWKAVVTISVIAVFFASNGRLWCGWYSLWVAEVMNDSGHHTGRERALTAIVAESAQLIAEDRVTFYPLTQLTPSRLRCDVGRVELCQFRSPVLPNLKTIVIHIALQRYIIFVTSGK